MHDFALRAGPRVRARAVPSWCLLAGLLAAVSATKADAPNPPVITLQPENSIAGLGEEFVFRATAAGAEPLSYQWTLGGIQLPGETNAVLRLTNVTGLHGGSYALTVTNAAGSVVSSNAFLTVMAGAARRLGTGRLLQAGAQVGVPITFRANGRENGLSFSLAYDTNALSNPVFRPRNTNALVTMDATQAGAVGIAVTNPGAGTFPAGYQWLGLMQFDLTAGSNVLQGGLVFTNQPSPIAAGSPTAASLTITASVQPQYAVATALPALRAQSGLFEQQLVIGNPGASTIAQVAILALSAGVDTRTNAIFLYNSHGSRAAAPYGDPLIEASCPCACGFALDAPGPPCSFDEYLACDDYACSLDLVKTNVPLNFAQIRDLLPGESRRVTLEFYVSDHLTVPQPKYSLYTGDTTALAPPSTALPLTITTNRFANGVYLIEFPTQLGRLYYVQYSSTPEGLVTNAQTAFPAVAGTGNSVQWTDNGPPKTASPPREGARFYRVLRGQ